MLKELLSKEINYRSYMGISAYVVRKYVLLFGVESFTIRDPALLLMKSGRLTIQNGEFSYNLIPHDLIFFPRKEVCTESKSAGKLQFYMIRFSPRRESKEFSFRQIDSFIKMAGQQMLKIHLDQSDYMVLSLICRLLDAEEKKTEHSDFEMELWRLSSNLLLFELKLLFAKYFTSEILHVSRIERMTSQFLAVLSIHCRKHHTVKFYAGVLYVTSGYLNRVVKEVTGKPVKKIITEALLTEAINLLEDSEYTIAAIAEELEFSSSSAFDIFFKKLMHCTPSEYRSNAAERFKSR